MKKITFFFLFLFTFVGNQISFAQLSNIEIGIRFAPVLVFNRVSGTASDPDLEGVKFEKDGGKVGILFGPTFDIPFKNDQYYISTGIFLVSKPVGVKATDGIFTTSQKFSTQYVQVPLSFKLFTDEVMPGGSVYFQLGGNLDIQVSRKAKEDNYDPILFSKATPLDIGLLFSSGFEYSIGNNKLFAGLTYIRGLVDAASDVKGLVIKNDMLCIDLGIKF